VCATDIDVEKLERAAADRGFPKDRTMLLGHDVREPGSFREVANTIRARFSRLDVMINNAGVMVVGPAHEPTDQDVELTLDINVKGVIYGSREAARLMIPQRSGHIINICSLSSLTPVPGLSVYSASKFAVRGYTLALGIEMKAHGVDVTCVNPDGIATPMLRVHAKSEHAALVFSGPRILSASEVSDAVLGTVLTDRPLEITLPASRGFLAKVASASPQLTAQTIAAVRWLGKRRQMNTKW